MPMTWKRSVNWNANRSKACALSPDPVSNTIGSPEPPQSSTSSLTPGATPTNLSASYGTVSYGGVSTQTGGSAATLDWAPALTHTVDSTVAIANEPNNPK